MRLALLAGVEWGEGLGEDLLDDRLALAQALAAGGGELVVQRGGGPGSVAGFAETPAGGHAVGAPTHPGFSGTPNPGALATPAELAARSFHDPDAFRAAPSPELAANVREVVRYGGDMPDPGLGGRLAAIEIPALVVWGESDRVADLVYGRAFAAAIPGARFAPLAAAGHMPQLEQPERLAELVIGFAGEL